MLRRALLKFKNIINKSVGVIMEAKPGDKRSADGTKKTGPVAQFVREDRKRKVALLVAYNGHGYYGLQLNPGMKSIEGDIIKALLDVGVIPQDHHDNVQKMSLQRASRTDKGVSAVGNILSLKMLVNVENLVEKINDKLPAQIRVIDFVRTTKGFNSKQHCCARTYHYLLPTFAFVPLEENVTEDYRVSLETIEKVNEALERFVGTHNFHNFTSGIKPNEQKALRTIRSFECHLPFEQDGLELCVISVYGQSFMLHQIRKMIGLTIAIVKGYANLDAIEKAWAGQKMDIPKAPGLGLMLEKLHYDTYNRKFCLDGSHPKLEFTHLKDQLQMFKKEQIYPQIIKQEKEEQSMMNWLATLPIHTCMPTDENTGKNRAFLHRVEKLGQEKDVEMSEEGEKAEDKQTTDTSTTSDDKQTTATGISDDKQATATGASDDKPIADKLEGDKPTDNTIDDKAEIDKVDGIASDKSENAKTVDEFR